MQNTANKTTVIQSPLTTYGQETRWAIHGILYSSYYTGFHGLSNAPARTWGPKWNQIYELLSTNAHRA